MMLKVGDKVKIRGDLEVGKKFGKCDFTKEMKKYRDKLAKIEFICGRFILLDIDNQEFGWTEDMFDKIEENNNMKELTFKEVITNIKEDEVWLSSVYEIKKDKEGIQVKRLDKNVEQDNNEIPFMYFYDSNHSFTLQRKQYTFEEAFKSFEKGREIESVYGTKYKLNKATEEVSIIETQCANKTSIYCLQDTLFRCDEIRGKWYINN
ncbi:hypothetical protein GNF86_01780 [Clostridium perfringens]